MDEDETEEIRALGDKLGRGLMLPDATSVGEERMIFLPRVASVILILFNRNHNVRRTSFAGYVLDLTSQQYIARRLLEENEHGKWLDPAKLDDDDDDDDDLRAQDDEIFELARRVSITVTNFVVYY